MRFSSLVKLAVVAGLIGGGAVAWKHYNAVPETTYTTTPADKGDISATISATGTCNALVTVQVGSQVSGIIQAIYVDYNSQVKKGQLIAKINPEVFMAKLEQANANLEAQQVNVLNAQAALGGSQADYASSQANVENQKANLLRSQVSRDDAKSKLSHEDELFRRGVVSGEEHDTALATFNTANASVTAAEAQVRAAQSQLSASNSQIEVAKTRIDQARAQALATSATLKQSNLDLSHTNIYSPVDGIVIARKMDVGQTVAASFSAPEIFEIAQDLTKMQVIATIDESEIGQIKEGQQVTFTVDAHPNDTFRGSVTQVRQAPTTTNGVVTYSAVIDVSNEDFKLFPGMTANVHILIERHNNVLRVPNSALRVRIDEPKAEETPAASATASAVADSTASQGGGRGRGGRGGGRRGEGGGGGGRGRGGSGGGSLLNTVWVLGPEDTPYSVRFLPGVSDDQFTEVKEVRSGELKAGDPIITFVASSKNSGGASANPLTPFGGRGGGRGRGF